MPALATRRIDAVVAAALAVMSVAQVLIFPIAPWPVGIVIAPASTVPVAFRHTHPVRALLVGTAPWLIPTDGYLVVGYVAAFLLLYSFAVQVDDLRLVLIAPVVLFGVSIWPLRRDDEPIGEWLGTILAVTVPVAVGRFVRRERERTRQMSVAEERARIARELHDVVAHGVSVIAVQADAAEAALEHDPARGHAAAEHPRLRARRAGGDAADGRRARRDARARPAAGARPAARADRGERHVRAARRACAGRGFARPHRVPDRAGGAHQCAQARRVRAGGIEATRRIAQAGITSRVLVLTTFDLDEYVYEALRAGASGFMLKDAGRERLVEAVRTVAAGDSLFAPSVLQRLVAHFVHRPPAGAARLDGPLAELSDREAQVLRLVGRGLSNAEIAEELVISQATVKTHVRHVLQKLGLRDRVQAVALAYETGLL